LLLLHRFRFLSMNFICVLFTDSHLKCAATDAVLSQFVWVSLSVSLCLPLQTFYSFSLFILPPYSFSYPTQAPYLPAPFSVSSSSRGSFSTSSLPLHLLPLTTSRLLYPLLLPYTVAGDFKTLQWVASSAAKETNASSL